MTCRDTSPDLTSAVIQYSDTCDYDRDYDRCGDLLRTNSMKSHPMATIFKAESTSGSIWHEYLEELWSKASSLFEKSEVQIGANRLRYFTLVIYEIDVLDTLIRE